MPNYKKILIDKNVQQQQLISYLKTYGSKLDTPLLSKIVNHTILPIPRDAKLICDYLKVDLSDIYSQDELLRIEAKSEYSALAIENKAQKKQVGAKAGLSPTLKLTIDVDREQQERIFSTEGKELLNIHDKSDCIRAYLNYLDRKLERLKKKEKIA